MKIWDSVFIFVERKVGFGMSYIKEIVNSYLRISTKHPKKVENLSLFLTNLLRMLFIDIWSEPTSIQADQKW